MVQIFWVQLITLCLYICFALIVYSAFGANTKVIAFDNLPEGDWIVNIVRLSMMMMMVAASYPFTIFPIFHVLETTFVDADDTMSRLMERWTIVLTTGMVAVMAGTHFGPVMSICGSLACVTAFILPPIFHLVIRTPKQRLSRLGDYLALVGGIFAFLSSMYGGIEGMLNSKEISS